jgi:hypothetical protein
MKSSCLLKGLKIFRINDSLKNKKNHPAGVLFFNFLVFTNWLHILGGGGTIGNQCDFFIGIVGMLHYFELGF